MSNTCEHIDEIKLDGTRPLSAELVAEVASFVDRITDSGPGRVAVLRLGGAPHGPRRLPSDAVQLVSRWEKTLRRLEHADSVTIAVATGDSCGGVALEALLATDYRLVRSDTQLLLPYTGDGSPWPGMALYRLTAQAGVARARHTVLLGDMVSAGDALAAGWVDAVADDPESGLAEAVERFGARIGRDIAVRRRLMFDATTAFEDSLGRHLAACDRALRHDGDGKTAQNKEGRVDVQA